MAVERSEAALKHLRTLWSEGAISSLGDRELLARFVAHTSDAAEAAFAALMERHAPDGSSRLPPNAGRRA